MPLFETKEPLSPVLFKKRVQYREPELTDKKALRAEDVLNQLVTVGELTFDADELSMDRLDRVATIAGWRFNQALAFGMTPEAAYQKVYVETLVPWKTSDNVFREVPAAVLCEVQEKALLALSGAWTRYG